MIYDIRQDESEYEDCYSPLAWERDLHESDEDYIERRQDLEDFLDRL